MHKNEIKTHSTITVSNEGNITTLTPIFNLISSFNFNITIPHSLNKKMKKPRGKGPNLNPFLCITDNPALHLTRADLPSASSRKRPPNHQLDEMQAKRSLLKSYPKTDEIIHHSHNTLVNSTIEKLDNKHCQGKRNNCNQASEHICFYMMQ